MDKWIKNKNKQLIIKEVYVASELYFKIFNLFLKKGNSN